MLLYTVWKHRDTETDISSRGLFGTRTFQHKNISAWVFFGTMDILARGRYGTGTFWHKDILAHVHLAQGHPCRNAYIVLQSAKMYICWNVLVPKYPCAVMFKYCNVPVPKRPWCRNIPIPKCSHAKMLGAEISPSHLWAYPVNILNALA